MPHSFGTKDKLASSRRSGIPADADSVSDFERGHDA
jgi:hypothetical protein